MHYLNEGRLLLAFPGRQLQYRPHTKHPLCFAHFRCGTSQGPFTFPALSGDSIKGAMLRKIQPAAPHYVLGRSIRVTCPAIGSKPQTWRRNIHTLAFGRSKARPAFLTGVLLLIVATAFAPRAPL